MSWWLGAGGVSWWRADGRVARGWWVALDGVVAWASAGIAVGGSGYTASLLAGSAVSRAAVAVWFGALLLRRLVPVAALWAGAGATVAVVAAGDPVTNLSLASALPLVVLLRTRPPAVAAVLAAPPVLAVLVALCGRPGALLCCALHAAAAAVGVAARRRDRARRVAAEERARRLLEEERARMARELHDAVGHAVTVMVTHAGAARLGAVDGPPLLRETLERIERVGRGAMGDLDRVLGLLEPLPPPTPLEPALRALLADLPPHLAVALELPSPAVELTAAHTEVLHQAVREALTNALKHSTATAATVRLHRTRHALRLAVTDNGRPAQVRSLPSSGRGLASARRRAAALGGRLTAGPGPEGWRVEVELPWP
ncbi:sensor histidine kinase [Kitasatospora phosalacinea]|uniref:sensor histidine kinase n=1 Tax=Kitasatospora phosalacinea TaxID=2065 RepID=UPI00255245E0|nr:histidine kinase [Kitasatospora phosalacinea]